jgi:hypothetical protein
LSIFLKLDRLREDGFRITSEHAQPALYDSHQVEDGRRVRLGVDERRGSK